jgi:hypothetical protein
LPPTGGEVVAWVALLAAVAISRILVAPEVLYDWDSANYALALVDFDVYEHQPHPPGNPVFVGMLRLSSWLPGGPTAPFLAVNALLGGATLLLLGAMVRRDGGPVLAWVLAALFAVCPLFWYQGAVASAYVAECFTSVLVAATALGVARRQVPLWLAGVLVAVAFGIRPNGVLTLGPVALLGVWMGRPSRREIALGLVGFVATSLLWLVPLLASGGGWARYREASAALVSWQLQVGSALGGRPAWLWVNTRNLVLYLFDAMIVLLPLLVLNVVVNAFRGARWRTPCFLAVWLHRSDSWLRPSPCHQRCGASPGGNGARSWRRTCCWRRSTWC